MTDTFRIDVPGLSGPLVVTRQDHPRGGYQVRVFGADGTAFKELQVDGRPLVPFIATDVQEQCASLDSAVAKRGSPLADLVKRCTQVADELTRELKWLQIDPATARKRDCARALWRALVDKDAIAQLERRLSSLRAQICTHIIISLP